MRWPTEPKVTYLRDVAGRGVAAAVSPYWGSGSITGQSISALMGNKVALGTIYCTEYSVFPCQYHSTNATYSFIHLPPTLYNVSLPVLQLSFVSIIPPMLHTHSYIYHERCIMFLSQYFSFPCQYHSTNTPYSIPMLYKLSNWQLRSIIHENYIVLQTIHFPSHVCFQVTRITATSLITSNKLHVFLMCFLNDRCPSVNQAVPVAWTPLFVRCVRLTCI
jgi:hypothetical protein